MSKLQSLILGALVGFLVIEGFVFYEKRKTPEVQSIPVTPAVSSSSVPIEPVRINTPPQATTTVPVSPTETPVASVVGYSDVLVIINSNSSSSREIGEYFAAQRGIHKENLVYINTTTSEEIDDSEFQNVRSQIESYMTVNNLKDKMNYIVTTKGVPLKVKREEGWMKDKSASVDSELTLIFSQDNQYIGGSGSVGSRYRLAKGHFAKTKYDMYLVTRLDGYTVDDVKAMINMSGPDTVVPSDALFVFDEDPNPKAPGLNQQEENAATSLKNNGFNVMFDKTAAYLTNQQNVVGYVSWGSNDHNATSTVSNAEPNNGWLPGSLAVTYVSSDGRTFNWPPVYGQSLIADILQEGATGAIGHVYEPYANAMPNVSVLFDRYTNGYNLAESFYSAMPFLSWQEVVVGDPKTTIVIQK